MSHRVQRESILACRHQVEVYISGWVVAHSHLTVINGGYLPVSTLLIITCRGCHVCNCCETYIDTLVNDVDGVIFGCGWGDFGKWVK